VATAIASSLAGAEIRVSFGNQRSTGTATGDPGQPGVVECLNCDADDYLVKPLRLDELLARVRRRLQDRLHLEPTSLTAGAIRLDLRTRRVTVAGHVIELSSLEFDLLETFLRHPEQVLSREQLLSQVWGTQVDVVTNVVAVAVRRLRNKIGRESIETVRGAGYRLTTGRHPASSHDV
jgi:DNA-binding response OmpR family regulator